MVAAPDSEVPQMTEMTSQPSVEALKGAVGDLPQSIEPPTVGSLEAEESAGGPRMPAIDPPSVTAVVQGQEDQVMHQMDGQVLPNGHGAHLGLAGGDIGMPGHARELGNGPETDERAPPMSADIDQPVAPTLRVDGDVAMDESPSTGINAEVPTAVDAPDPAPLPSHLAPATEPGLAPAEASLSAVSNASAPPSPAGEAAAVAAKVEEPQDAVMMDAVGSPPVTKRPAEEDDVERDAKRQRYDEVPEKPELPLEESLSFSADSSMEQSHPGQAEPYQPDGYATFEQHGSYSSAPSQPGISGPIPPEGESAAVPELPEASTSSLPPLDTSAAPPEAAISQPIGSSAPSSSYDAPYSPTVPMGTIDPGALSNPPSASLEGSPIAPALPPPMPTKLAKEHLRFAESIVRQLRKQRESLPFLVPVDPVALNIPQYFNFIKNPMDLGTIEKNLKSQKYRTIDEWIADVRLIWSNCYTFNGAPGPNAPVSISAKVMEDLFEKQIQKIPPIKPPAPPKPKALPGYRAGPSSHQNQLRRASGGRPVRAPQPYEPEFDDPRPKFRPTGAAGSQMRYARDILRDVMKKSNEGWTVPFRYPVDPMQYPDYPRIVKKPMDLSTVQRKFDMGEYASIEHFAADMRLICKNCFLYNPVGTPVHEMGRKLEHLVESKMLQMPDFDEDEEDFYGFDGEDKDPKIAAMERQLAEMQRNLASMKQQKKAPPKPKAPPRPRASPEHQRRPSAPKTDYMSDDYEDEGVEMVQTPGGPREVTFDMKRELATKITTFEGPQLEQAIEIIRNSVPHLLGVRLVRLLYNGIDSSDAQDESKEIELDIDQLDGATLYKLYEFVVGVQTGGPKSPVRRKPEATLTAAGVRAQKSGRAGTGGLKGTHLDETIESAKIAALEEKLNALENNGVGSPSAGANLGASTNNAATEDASSSEDAYSSDSDQD